MGTTRSVRGARNSASFSLARPHPSHSAQPSPAPSLSLSPRLPSPPHTLALQHVTAQHTAPLSLSLSHTALHARVGCPHDDSRETEVRAPGTTILTRRQQGSSQHQ